VTTPSDRLQPNGDPSHGGDGQPVSPVAWTTGLGARPVSRRRVLAGAGALAGLGALAACGARPPAAPASVPVGPNSPQVARFAAAQARPGAPVRDYALTAPGEVAVAAAGAARISPPWCAACGRELTAMQLRGQDWYCSSCYARPQPCAACGQQRQVTFRDRHGRPRCSGCPDQDVRDPRRVLVGLIAALDPGLSTDAVSTAITATISKPAHEEKLMWAIGAAPELLTGAGAKAPFPMVLRLIEALCAAGATRIQPPACPRCRRVIALSKRRDGLRICRNCAARANAVACSGCGTVREPAGRDAHGDPLCPNCLVRDPINLEERVRCGRRQPVNTRASEGPICASCIPRTTATCSVCGRTAPCIVSKTTGAPWCRACARAWAECSRCRQWAAIRAGTCEAPLCAGCAVPDPGFWKTCPTCGTSERLIAGVCRRCQLHQHLGSSPTPPDRSAPNCSPCATRWPPPTGPTRS